MKRRLVELIHGILFGMSCMIPGFSGGTMLLILGIYEKFTASVAKLSKKPLQALNELWVYIVGALCGLGLAAVTVVACLNHFPIIMSGLFVGFVFGTIPVVIKNIKKTKCTIGSIVTFICFLAVALVMAFSEELHIAMNTNFEKASVLGIIYIILISTLGSGTMIIPAASGMTVLLIFGVYYPLMTTLGEIIKGLGHFDFQPLINKAWFILPFIIGIFIGTIGVARVISKLLDKHASMIWYAILALLIVSPITIFKDAYQKRVLPFPDLLASIQSHIVLQIILAILFAILGFFLLLYVDKIQTQRLNKKESEVHSR